MKAMDILALVNIETVGKVFFEALQTAEERGACPEYYPPGQIEPHSILDMATRFVDEWCGADQVAIILDQFEDDRLKVIFARAIWPVIGRWVVSKDSHPLLAHLGPILEQVEEK